MSQLQMGNSKTKSVPPPPPPPPLKSVNSERQPKLKTKGAPSQNNSPLQIRTKTSSGSKQTTQGKQVTALSSPTNASQLIISDESSEELVPQNSNKNKNSDDKFESGERNKKSEMKVTLKSQSRKTNNQPEPDVEIVRNDVSFFNEEQCTDSEDEFSFTCCMPPNSPRYPPNPRPYREWDPSFLPSNTNIPTSIGRKCRRCGKPVYVAELYLSSRGVYHSECYKCCLCGKTLDSWSVAEFKGEVFCKGCYRRNFGAHGVGFGVGAGVLQTP